jgi:peptidoglycan hydrolase-like protein with peptidoglycan-binding domain
VTDQVWLLVIGFLLTSVVGGSLGYLFQARAWNHQHETTRRDNEREQALKTFEEVSTRMDKRLYRTQRLYWAASQRSRGGGDQAQWDEARADYRVALYEWNDNLNRTLALVQTYFGATLPLARFGKRLGHLSRRVYQLNVHMLSLLENGSLGPRAPREDAHRREADEPTLELGAHGAAVRVLQQRLHDGGHPEVPVDGEFGPKTHTAALSVQRSRNLDIDGIVGPRTWASL